MFIEDEIQTFFVYKQTNRYIFPVEKVKPLHSRELVEYVNALPRSRLHIYLILLCIN